MRLYGGAQYHRAMAEFRLVVGGMKCPPITREEIVNACGVEDIHDGTNYSRCCPSPKKFKNNKRKKKQFMSKCSYILVAFIAGVPA
jgi:hypothetical protein